MWHSLNSSSRRRPDKSVRLHSSCLYSLRCDDSSLLHYVGVCKSALCLPIETLEAVHSGRWPDHLCVFPTVCDAPLLWTVAVWACLRWDRRNSEISSCVPDFKHWWDSKTWVWQKLKRMFVIFHCTNQRVGYIRSFTVRCACNHKRKQHILSLQTPTGKWLKKD